MVTREEVLQKILDTVRPMTPVDISSTAGNLDLVDDLGLDSVKVMEILETLEDSFDISIPISILPGVRTVKELAEEIHTLTGSEY